MLATVLALTIGKQAWGLPLDREAPIESKLEIRSQGHAWRFEVRSYKPWIDDAEYGAQFLKVSRDGKLLWWRRSEDLRQNRLPFGFYLKIGRVNIRSKHPIVAVRGHTGIGEHMDTLFYSVQGDKLVRVGKPPAFNSHGPINYKGRLNEWLFDDYNWYLAAKQDWALRYVLCRFDKYGKLYQVRSWKSSGKNLPDTVRLWF